MAQLFSFMEDGVWSPTRTGKYEPDCQIGRDYAEETVSAIRRLGNPALFGTVARAITEGGKFEAVEIGFCSAVGIAILTGH